MLIQLFKVYFPSKELQNFGSVPHVVQYILEPTLQPTVYTSHSPISLTYPPGHQTYLQTPSQSQHASSAWKALTGVHGRQLTGTGAK